MSREPQSGEQRNRLAWGRSGWVEPEPPATPEKPPKWMAKPQRPHLPPPRVRVEGVERERARVVQKMATCTESLTTGERRTLADYRRGITRARSLTASAVLESPDADGSPASAQAPAKSPARWLGVIGVEGELTGDGRFIASGALSWGDLPIPLRFVAADEGGHRGAVVVGHIDTITRDVRTGEIRPRATSTWAPRPDGKRPGWSPGTC